jgi:hypothetical protein
VLRIVSDEVRSHGFCNLTVPEIAARAGVGQTKARMALKEAARLGLATVEERRIPCRPNLPNVVRIISREWLAWIARAGRGEGGRREFQKVSSASKAPLLGRGFTSVKATDSKGLQEGLRDRCGPRNRRRSQTE